MNIQDAEIKYAPHGTAYIVIQDEIHDEIKIIMGEDCLISNVVLNEKQRKYAAEKFRGVEGAKAMELGDVQKCDSIDDLVSSLGGEGL